LIARRGRSTKSSAAQVRSPHSSSSILKYDKSLGLNLETERPLGPDGPAMLLARADEVARIGRADGRLWRAKRQTFS
jgi:hypothetical protein